MELALQIFIAVSTIVLVLAWAMIVFNYPAMKDKLNLTADDTAAMGLIRGDIAGMLLTIAIFQGLFLIQGDMWAIPAIVATVAVNIGRITSGLVDGWSKMNIQGIIVEWAGIAAIILLWRDIV